MASPAKGGAGAGAGAPLQPRRTGGAKRKDKLNRAAAATAAARAALEGDSDSEFEIDDVRFRDDSNMSLFDMLRNEDLRPADLLHMKRLFEKNGKWTWEAPDAVRRARVVVDPGLAAAPSAAREFDPYQVLADAEKRTAAERARRHASAAAGGATVQEIAAAAAAAAAASAAAAAATMAATGVRDTDDGAASVAPSEVTSSAAPPPRNAAVEAAAAAAGAAAAAAALLPRARPGRQCRWRGKDDNGFVYCCLNETMYSEKARAFTATCPYHTRFCVAVHAEGALALAFPNDQALCAMHYRGAYGVQPVSYAGELNTPGVILLRAARVKHPLAPATEPPPELTPEQRAAAAAAAARDAFDAKRAAAAAAAEMATTANARAATLAAVVAGGGGGAPPASATTPAAASAAVRLGTDTVGAAGYTERVVPLSTAEVVAARARRALTRAALPTLRTLRHVLPHRVTAALSTAAGVDVAEVRDGDAAERVAAAAAAMTGKPVTLRDKVIRSMYTHPLTRERFDIAATVVQSLVRRHLARRAVARMRDDRIRAARLAAALVIQRALRTRVARRRFRALFATFYRAATLVQRAYRFHRYHTAVAYKRRLVRAATSLQRWWRVVRLQYHLHLLHDATAAAAAAVIEGHATDAIRRMVRSYRQRKLVAAALEGTQRVAHAVTALARKFRDYRRRQTALALSLGLRGGGSGGVRAVSRREEIRLNAAVFRINAWWRRLRMKWEARFDRRAVIRTITHVQRIGRGFLARNRVRAMLLRRDAARSFLAPGLTRVQLNRTLAPSPAAAAAAAATTSASASPVVPRLTAGAAAAAAAASGGRRTSTGRSGKAGGSSSSTSAVAAAVDKLRSARKLRVPVLGGVQTASDDARDTDPDFLKIKAHVTALEASFMAADKVGHGYVSRAVFARLLTASGFTASTALAIKLQNLFLAAGDVVDYRSYIAFARTLRYVCPLHKVLVCPVCLFTGACEACTCTAYACDPVAAADLYHRRAGICACGHHQRRHMPGMVVHPETAVPAPDPLVLRLTLPRVSSLARDACGGLTNPRTFDEAVATEAFRSTLATDQAPVMEELAATLSLGAAGLRSLETAARAKAEREELATRAAVPPMSAAQRRALAASQRTARVAAAVSKKWTSLDAFMDSVDDTLHAEAAATAAVAAAEAAAAAMPPPTEEELALYKDDAELAAHLPGMRLHLARVAAAAVGAPGSPTAPSPTAAADDDAPPASPPPKKSLAAALAAANAARAAAEERARGTTAPGAFFVDGETVPQRDDRLVREAAAAAAASERLKHTGAVLVRPPREALGNRRVLATLARVRDDVHEAASVRELAVATLRYWHMLLQLAYPAPDGSDVVGSERGMTDLIFHNYDFLARWWRDLVADIRGATVAGGPPGLTAHQRRLMAAAMVRDDGRATMLEQVFHAYFAIAVAADKADAPLPFEAGGPVKREWAAKVHLAPPAPAPTATIGRIKPSPYVTSLPPLDPPRRSVAVAAPDAAPMATPDLRAANVAVKLPLEAARSRMQPLSMFSLASVTAQRPPRSDTAVRTAALRLSQEAPPATLKGSRGGAGSGAGSGAATPTAAPTAARGARARAVLAALGGSSGGSAGSTPPPAGGAGDATKLAPPLVNPLATEAYGCPYPTCGARFTSSSQVQLHLRYHDAAPAVATSSEADAYLLRMWDRAGLNAMLAGRAPP